MKETAPDMLTEGWRPGEPVTNDQQPPNNALAIRIDALRAELRALAESPRLPAAARQALARAEAEVQEAQATLPTVADLRGERPAGQVQAEVHTIGIAVQDLEAARRAFETVFQAPLVREAIHQKEGSRWAWYQLGPVAVELIAPTGPESRVQRFLDRHGEGLFLLALRVPDMQRAIDGFREAGLQVVHDQGRPGFPGGGSNNFVHPKSFFGTLIEFRDLPEADP